MPRPVFPGYRYNVETGDKRLFKTEAEFADAEGEWVRDLSTVKTAPPSKAEKIPPKIETPLEELSSEALIKLAVDKGFEVNDDTTRQDIIDTLKELEDGDDS